MSSEDIRLCAQNLLTISGSIAINIIEGPMYPSSNKKENLHFDHERDIHTSSKKYEENSDGHNLDLLIIWN